MSLRHPFTSIPALVVLSLMLAGCAGSNEAATSSESDASTVDPTITPDAPVAMGSNGLVELDPADTSAALTPGFGAHVIGAPEVEPSGELLVFLPGTGGQPRFYSTLLDHALGLGHHVIGLAYPNELAVNFDLCGETDDRDCQGRAREEILFGLDASGLDRELDVSPEDSVTARLDAALDHLIDTRRAEGWDAFVDDGEPVWSSIVVAGHSQGGGHAAYLARDLEFARVVLFGSTEPAPWTQHDFATPPDRFWGLAHTREPIIGAIERSWRLLDIPGAVTDIDEGLERTGSHRLVTSSQDCTGDPESFGFFHGCPVTDLHLPDPVPEALLGAWTRVLSG